MCVALIFKRARDTSKPGRPRPAPNSGSVYGATPYGGSILYSKIPHAADRVWRGHATYTRGRTTTAEVPHPSHEPPLYHSYCSSAAVVLIVVSSTLKESTHHPPCVYNHTAVQQSTADKSIHQRTISPCMYMIVQQDSRKYSEKRRHGDSNSALLAKNRALYR